MNASLDCIPWLPQRSAKGAQTPPAPHGRHGSTLNPAGRISPVSPLCLRGAAARLAQELQRLLRCAAAGGLQYTWIDWCCVPQYSAPSMVEVLRSKVYYARARTMLVLPTFAQLPATTCTPIKQQLQAAIGRMKDASVSLAKASTKLAASAEKKEGEEDGGKAEGQEKASKEGEGAEGKAGEGSDEAKAAAALVNQRVVAAVVEDLLAKGLYADGAYFGRAWTLAERMARFGRRECLCQWMSLEVRRPRPRPSPPPLPACLPGPFGLRAAGSGLRCGLSLTLASRRQSATPHAAT